MSKRLSDDEVHEALTTIVLAIHDDRKFSRWFERLAQLSAVQRRNEIYRMREELHTGGHKVREDIVASMSLLAEDQVFKAAWDAFRIL